MQLAKDSFTPFEDQLPRFEAAIARLASWGIRIHPSSRLQAYSTRLRRAVADPSPYVPEDFAIQLMYDLREIDEIITIVESFEGLPPTQVLAKLSELARGSEAPDDDRSTQARDTHYELALYSLFQSSGLVVELGEPDLLVTVLGHTVPIAAKRPTSESRVDDRLRSAVAQLGKVGRMGLIALSLDQVIRPRGKFMEVETREQAADAVSQSVRQFVLSHLTPIRQRVNDRPVSAILFTAVVPGRAKDSGTLITAQAFHLEMLVPESTDDGRIAIALGDLVSSKL